MTLSFFPLRAAGDSRLSHTAGTTSLRDAAHECRRPLRQLRQSGAASPLLPLWRACSGHPVSARVRAFWSATQWSGDWPSEDRGAVVRQLAFVVQSRVIDA